MNFKIRYEVDDGSAGGSPRYFNMDDSDFQWCETQSEVEDTIRCAVQNDFENSVYPCFAENQVTIEELEELREEEEED